MKIKKNIPLIDQHDKYGFWGGKFGGSFIPETLKKPVEDLTQEFEILRNNKKFINLIGFVKDRPGHDRKYILNSNKIKKRLNWKPSINFNQGLKQTIEYYLNQYPKYKRKN